MAEQQNEEAVALFTSITGASAEVAQSILEAHNNDVERAVSWFFEHPEAAVPGGEGVGAAVDMSEEDARVAAALMNEDIMQDEPPPPLRPPAIDLTGDDDMAGLRQPSGSAAARNLQQPPFEQETLSDDMEEEEDEGAMLRRMAATRAAGLAAAQQSQQTMEAMMNMTRGMLGPNGMPSMFPGMAFGGAGPPGSFPAGRGAGSGSAPSGRSGPYGLRGSSGLEVRGRGVGAGAGADAAHAIHSDDDDPDAALARQLMEEDERAARRASHGPAGGGAVTGPDGGLGDGDLDHLGVDKHELEEARMIEAAMMGIPYEPRLPTRGQGGQGGSASSAPHDPAMFEQRSLRWEQDRDFEESLAADKAKADAAARVLREAEEAARQEREAAEAATRAEQEEAARLAALLKRKAASLPAEPEAGAGVVTVMIRMPDGGRLSRRFSIGNSLQALFDFIDLQQQQQQPPGTLKPGTYKLVNSYPRKVFTTETEGSLEGAGITADTALFVEPA